MMDQLVERFTEQLREAVEIGQSAKISAHTEDINAIYVTGMGGSSIGGSFAAEFVKDELKVPYVFGQSYQIPAWVNKHTLAIASSYSGNTEETLSSFNELLTTGAKVVVIASGGKLIELAKTHQLDYILLPSDWPSPRACLGYSVVQQLFVLRHLGLIGDTRINEINASIKLLDQEAENIKEKASKICDLIVDKIPVIYTTDRMSSVAVRYRQQINENAKMLCWHHILPEMNHNELVGWRDEYNNIAVLFLRNADDFSRNDKRIDITKEIIGNCTNTIIDIYSKGNSLVERALYLVHLGDWLSVYMAERREMDSIEVKVIDYLKSELGKV